MTAFFAALLVVFGLIVWIYRISPATKNLSAADEDTVREFRRELGRSQRLVQVLENEPRP